MRTTTRGVVSVSAACVAAATLVLVQPGPAGAGELPAKFYFTSNATTITAHVTAGKVDDQLCRIKEPGTPDTPYVTILKGTTAPVERGFPAGKHSVQLLCAVVPNPAAMVKSESVSVPPGPMDQFRDMMEGFGS